MAITITSPQFEFVNFNTPPVTCGNNAPCLPVYDLSDLQFQVIASVTGADKTGFGADNTYLACITLGGAHITTFEAEYKNTWNKITTGSGTDPDVYQGFYIYNSVETLFAALAPGECFTISVYNPPLFDSDVRTILATTTTCFYKVTDPCYTSLVVYTNASDAFGFNFTYNGIQFESIRLPFYLHSPANAEEQMSYAKSDGSTLKLSHRIWKDYKFKMDYLDDATIEKFAVATACDIVKITNPYSGVSAETFVRTDKVEVEWWQETMPGVNLGAAKGTLRLADIRAYVNSNCG